jgi:hypothetical protein
MSARGKRTLSVGDQLSGSHGAALPDGLMEPDIGKGVAAVSDVERN